MFIVAVDFNSAFSNKLYHFKCDIEGIDVGDKVVVDTANGLAVAEVAKVITEGSNKATKWVVDKIDMSAHEARLEKQKKLEELKEKMEQRRKEIQEFEIYRILAKEDEEMAELVKNLDDLLN